MQSRVHRARHETSVFGGGRAAVSVAMVPVARVRRDPTGCGRLTRLDHIARVRLLAGRLTPRSCWFPAGERFAWGAWSRKVVNARHVMLAACDVRPGRVVPDGARRGYEQVDPIRGGALAVTERALASSGGGSGNRRTGRAGRRGPR